MYVLDTNRNGFDNIAKTDGGGFGGVANGTGEHGACRAGDGSGCRLKIRTAGANSLLAY